MVKAIAITLLVLLAGCASKPQARLSKLPALYPYTQQELGAINAERPVVKACCPQTDRAMIHYGKLRDKIRGAEKLEKGG